MPKKKVLTATSPQEWRKLNTLGTLIELPSGKVARLRKPDLFTLVRAGKIPNALAGKVTEMIKKQKADIADFDASELADLLDIVAKAAFVEPQVVDKPTEDNQISPSDIDFTDKSFVFQYAQGGTSDLEFFRREQGRNVSPAQDGQELQPEAEPDSGDKPQL